MFRQTVRWLFVAMSLFAVTAYADLPPNIVRIHYHRTAGEYAGWGLHVWGQDLLLPEEVIWSKPVMPAGRDDFGVYFDVPAKPGNNEIGFILHLGEQKNHPNNMVLFPNVQGREIWQLEDDAVIYTTMPDPKVIASRQATIDMQNRAAILAPLTALNRDKTDAATLKIINGVRLDAETRLRTLAKNVVDLQANLLVTQQARDVAEQRLKIAKKDATNQSAPDAKNILLWRTLFAAALIFLGLSVWLARRKQSKQHAQLSVLETEIADAHNRMQKEMEERQSAEQRILQLANYDELTHLPNRAILNQTLAQAVAKCKRYKQQLAILFIDLDRFKFINDTMGHEAGDYVLKTIAERLKQCLRETDTIARLGGDEFVVVIESLSDPKYVAGVAQKLVVTAQQPFVIQGQECSISASIGISTYPSDGKDAITLLKNADIAMYRAKEQGKNNFQYFSEQMNMHSLERLALESSLRHALTRNELRVHYQPIVETSSLRIVGVEALVRWQHPDMGMVGPLQFIPIAEETGLIVHIGRWVLETACQQGRVWRELGYPLNISVNLSPRQLSEPDIVSEFTNVFVASGFPASELTLEITESLMLNRPEETVEILQKLKSLGVRIAIDDFGTGYSSLAYLRRFPVDTLKIDRSFMQDIPVDPDSSVLTAAVIALSHSMHLNVTAEGVETDEQRNFLIEHKCERLQGYWFCKPKPAEEITDLLKNQSSNNN